MPTKIQTQLNNYQKMYDVVDGAPGINANEIAALTGRIPSVIRSWMRIMQTAGMVEIQEGLSTRMPNQFYAIPGKRPTQVPAGRGAANSDRDRIAEQNEYAPRRPWAPAEQVGMWRDELVVAIFGPAP